MVASQFVTTSWPFPQEYFKPHLVATGGSWRKRKQCQQELMEIKVTASCEKRTKLLLYPHSMRYRPHQQLDHPHTGRYPMCCMFWGKYIFLHQHYQHMKFSKVCLHCLLQR